MAQVPIETPSGLNFDDIQADILIGIPKRAEQFLFFQILDPAQFRVKLGTDILPLITTTTQVRADRERIAAAKLAKSGLVPLLGINIAFSATGLATLGITEDLGDPSFADGQLKAAQALGDQGTIGPDGQFQPAWLPEFTSNTIHGVFLVAGDSAESVYGGIAQVLTALGSTARQVYKLDGTTRPGAEKGHEHFGFNDGISLPVVQGVDTPLPGQQVVRPGILLIGQEGDPSLTSRPDWATNGSFLVFRQLNQLVPEFNDFLEKNPLTFEGLTREEGSALLGARMVGRWKSGAPIDITPLKDDPVLAADPQKNNNFDFSTATDQTRCPFSAHVRKTNPRSDLANFGGVELRQINRSGITFGPEVTPEESASKTTAESRGLAFVCYQTVIANGFEFIQQSWANNPGFIFGRGVNPGFDPIIGANGNNPRVTAGMDINAQSENLTLPIDFVVAKGGEYFFSPSLSALRNKFSSAAQA